MYRAVNWTFDQINRRSPILFQSPTRSFGNGAEEIFYGLLKAKREGKKALFLYPRLKLFGKGFSVANRELFHLTSDYSIGNESIIGLLGGWLLSIYLVLLYVTHRVRRSRIFRRACRLILPRTPLRVTADHGHTSPQIGTSTLRKPYGVDHFSWDVVARQNWRRQYDEYTPPSLREDKHRQAEETRLRMGIPLTDWFVCLHFRETWPPTVRNASSHNSIEGIKAITDAGGWVVRIGEATMTPLPQMERVVDYAHTPYKSALMDMYIISHCRFFIGIASGPTFVATLFQRPQVLVNMTDWSLGLPLDRGGLTITKHVFSRSRNRFLSVQEILEEPYEVHVFDVPSDEYVMIENTPEEIRDVVEEFLAQQEPYEYTELQEAFNEGRLRQIRRWLEEGEPRWYGVPQRDIFLGQYRIGVRAEEASGTLGRKFLEQNWLSDQLGRSMTHDSLIP